MKVTRWCSPEVPKKMCWGTYTRASCSKGSIGIPVARDLTCFSTSRQPS